MNDEVTMSDKGYMDGEVTTEAMRLAGGYGFAGGLKVAVQNGAEADQRGDLRNVLFWAEVASRLRCSRR